MTYKNERQDMFRGGHLKNIKFEIVVKNFEGNTQKSYLNTTTLSALDFNWLADPFFPKLDILKYIEVKGDYFSVNQTDKRTITNFRMLADYESFIIDAFNDTVTNYENNDSGDKCADIIQQEQLDANKPIMSDAETKALDDRYDA